MKRKMTEKVANIVAEESSDGEEDIDEEQVSENEQEMEVGDDESDASDNDDGSDQDSDVDLAASATDSDDDDDGDEIDDDEDVSDTDKPNEEDDIKVKTKAERIRDELLEKYQDRQGKQLYIRFPHKVADTLEALEKEVKELTPLVVKVHKPRQKHARFCLVDFATREDRDTAFKQLKKSFSKGDLAKYVVNIPKTESQELVSELAERKIKSFENKKAKNRLRKASKKALTENQFTSTVIVLNLPKLASVAQIRELFPNAVDIQVKPGKGKLYKEKSIAAINLPSTMDARNAIKKKLSLGGNQLTIKFDNQKMGRNKNKKPLDNKNPKNETEEATIQSAEISEPSNKKAKLETKIETPEKVNQNNEKSLGNQKDKKPFNKGKKPFNKDKKPFNKDKKPFNKDKKPFNNNDKKPFNKGNKPFNKNNKGKNNFKNKSKPVNK